DLARDPDPPRALRPTPRRDPRLRLGRLPLHRLCPRGELQRHPGRDAARCHPAAPGKANRPRSALGSRNLRQVRPGRARPDADDLRIEAPPGDALRGGVRSGIRRGDALAGDRSRPAHLLREDDRLSRRPQLALQHLGPGAVTGTPPRCTSRRHRRSLAAARLPPPQEIIDPSRGPGSGPPDRPPNHHAPLVLPLHSLVLAPVPARDLVPGERDRPPSERLALLGRPNLGKRRSPHPSKLMPAGLRPRSSGYELSRPGTGTITCSKESASPRSLTSTAAPIT